MGSLIQYSLLSYSRLLRLLGSKRVRRNTSKNQLNFSKSYFRQIEYHYHSDVALELQIFDNDAEKKSKPVSFAFVRLFLMDEDGTCPGSSSCCKMCRGDNLCDNYLPLAMTHKNKDKPCFAKEKFPDKDVDNKDFCSPRIVEGTDDLDPSTEDFEFQVAQLMIIYHNVHCCVYLCTDCLRDLSCLLL